MAGIRRKDISVRNNNVISRDTFEAACKIEERTRKVVLEMMSNYVCCIRDDTEIAGPKGDWTKICIRNANAVKSMVEYAEQQGWSYAEYQNAIREITMK